MPKPLPFRFYTGIALMLGMLAVVWVSGHMNRPPEVVAEDAPPTTFSAERAWKHLEKIGAVKNPIGSKENAMVRDYILNEIRKLGFEPALEETTYFDTRLQRVAELGNILVRIPGSGNGKAILFMGHYDTVADAYGAADNGSAVAAMLELMRMLRHHPQLKNDLIFFFPDGEEVGLLGAKAFLESHHWAQNVGFVVNLEARGTTGQSFMFETGHQNLRTIAAFADAVPHPAANSISYEVYARMPNDTDFSPFKQMGYPGLNMAFIENAFDYHTAMDNLENTDIRAIQHHGSYATSIALELGNQELDFEVGQNAVYFNTIGYGFAFYPYGWALPITIGVVFLFGVMLWIGVRKNLLNPLQWLKGIAAFTLYLVLLYAILHALYALMSGLYPESRQLLLSYHQPLLIPGLLLLATSFSLIYYRMVIRGICFRHAVILFLFLTALLSLSGEISLLNGLGVLAVSALLLWLFRKPTSAYDLGTGAMCCFAILMVYTAIAIPGASYLPTWPLAAMVVGYLLIALLSGMKDERGSARTGQTVRTAIILLLAALPALIWYPWLAGFFTVAMGLPYVALASLLIGGLTGLAIPHIDIMTRTRPAWAPGILLLAGIAFLAAGTVGKDYDDRYKKPVNLRLVQHADHHTLKWITADGRVNEWTAQFLGEEPGEVQITDVVPLDNQTYHGRAAILPEDIPAPEAMLLKDTVKEGERMLLWQVHPAAGATRSDIYLHAEQVHVEVRIDDLQRAPLRPHRGSQWRRLHYFAPPEEGFNLSIYTDPNKDIKLHLVDTWHSLPGSIAYEEMPAHMMPRGHQTQSARTFLYSP